MIKLTSDRRIEIIPNAPSFQARIIYAGTAVRISINFDTSAQTKMSPLTITKVTSLNNVNLYSSQQPTAVKTETRKLLNYLGGSHSVL
jgi:hypothetical protein